MRPFDEAPELAARGERCQLHRRNARRARQKRATGKRFGGQRPPNRLAHYLMDLLGGQIGVPEDAVESIQGAREGEK